MGRIPKAELERLKREVSVRELAEARGVRLAPHGDNLIGLCPFHDDREPSLVISPGKNLWNCLGACGKGGSVVDWVMVAEGVSFRHAVEILKAKSPALTTEAAPPPKRSTVVKLPPPVAPEATDCELLDQVAGYYHETLKQSPEAMGYLESRGLGSEELVDRFRLGFANRTLGYRLPQSNRREGQEVRGRLQELGVIRSSGHEHLNGSLVIPIHDAEGRVVQLYGRKVTQRLRKGTPLHLYLPGPRRGVFNLDALRESREVILCEALIDALTFWRHGYRHVTAAYGVNGFTDELLQAMKAYGTERVLVAYDRDDAGERAAAKLAERLGGEGVSCFRVLFPRGMDVNEYALKVTPAAQSLGVALRSAQHVAGPVGSLLVVGCRLMDNDGDGRGEELPGLGGVAAGDGAGADGVRAPEGLSEGGDLRAGRPCEAGCGVDPGEPRGGPGEAAPEGVSPASGDRQGQPRGAEHTAGRGREARLRDGNSAGGGRGGPGEHRPSPQRSDDPAARPLNPLTDNQQPTTPLPAAASPAAPPAPAADVEAKVSDHEVVVELGDRRWRVRGLARNLSFESLKVNLLVARGERFHVDSLELYSARQRASFLKQAVEELQVDAEVVKKDLGKVLLKLEELQEAEIRRQLEPDEDEVTLTSEERAEALELLGAPDLLERISASFAACGLVGERTNTLVAYLAAVSRKLERPLAVMVQSSSAAGKSALIEAVLAFVPEEERAQYSAMTGQSLFYMGETDLRHKVLAIAEEEGAERASYALKLLQSEGKLSIASTGKDPSTGRLVTHTYQVEGPAAILLTTTAVDLDEELLNRCVVLAVDESREQTRAIHRLQRESRTLEGLERRLARQDTVKLQQNAQRLLRPLFVVNPYARRLTFLDDTTRTRRDHEKYLGLIDALALLHQRQRPVRTGVVAGRRVDYVEATLDDIATANLLAADALGRTLDELPPQTRRFLDMLRELVAERCEAEGVEQSRVRFTRREILDHTRWTYPQVRKHVDRLVDHEYLLVHRGGRGQSFVYELLWKGEGRRGESFVMGLIPVESLAEGDGTTTALTPSRGDLDPPLTPHCPPLEPPLISGSKAAAKEESPDPESSRPRNAHQGTARPRFVVAAAGWAAPATDNQQPATTGAGGRD